ncbi:Cna B-type domain-containing protein [Mogibacterium diversum]|uniref:Cna B-type domain-containing protein n=1 Tax=Mogibacterium diversum TaxID=114527 RepID=UPI0026E9940B|nr:Cna B-type domain-containing protein [Mogibacterium diversum]
MNARFKAITKKLIVVVLSCIMLLGIMPIMGKAFAESYHNDVITDVKLTKADLVTPATWADVTTRMQLVVKFALNNRVHAGDKTIIHVPNEFEIVKRESFAIKSPSGETIANAVTDPDAKTVTITYANYVDSHSDISGSLHVTVKIDTDVVTSGQTMRLRLVMDGGRGFDINPFVYAGVRGDNPDEHLYKRSYFDNNDPTIVRTRIRVNGKGGNFQKLTVKDTIETPAVSYSKDSFRITKGKWEIGADGYFTLKNEIDVTNQFPINFDGNSFTIDFNNVQGEGYYIKYDMKLSYRPVNQEIVNNRISGYNDAQVIMDEVIRAVYQESGGEANGYHFTIKIHKENENGDSLSGAVFEVIRESSGVKVGEITTDSNGNGSLGGLLKDKYTIKEKKAPEGYMLSADAVRVAPEEFGPDKSVTKTIKNSYAPDETSVTVTKRWDDGNDKDKLRPESVKVQLYANGVKKGAEVTLKKSENWTYTWNNLPEKKSGQKIKYTVKEVNRLPGYVASVDDANHGNIIITNTHTPKETPKKDIHKKGNSPKTGDSSKPVQSAFVLCASSVMLAVVAAKKRRKNIQ